MKHYFAYGTLLGEKAMQDFAPSARAVGVMRLDGYELDFAETHVAGKGGCWLRPTEGGSVYGVQYEVSDADLAHMDKASGIPEGLWVHQPVTLTDAEGNEVNSLTYTIPGAPPAFEPTSDYVGKVKDGLETTAVPPDYADKVDRRIRPFL